MENEQAKSQSVQAYPTYGIEDCIAVARAVKEAGGLKTPISKSLIASRLGVGSEDSRLASQIASARTYGILTGRGDYILTEAAKKYFSPHSAQDATIGLLAFLESPPPFKKLIERFDGSQLPDTSFIANILESEADVPKSWSKRVASLFLQAAKFAGAIDSGGFLRHEASIHGTSLDAAEEDLYKEGQERVRSLTSEKVSAVPKAPLSDCNVWDFTLEGKVVHLETSKDLTRPLWEKLEAYIKVIEPPIGR